MRRIDVHKLTPTQLDHLRAELREEISSLRAVLHDLGPSLQRESALLERRGLLEQVERELAHRRKDPHY